MINYLKPIFAMVLTMSIVFTGNLLVVEAAGLTILKKSELNVDLSRIKEVETYGTPRSIILAPVNLPSGVDLDYADWYRGLFYYLTSERYNYADMPVHYLVDPEGNIYEGAQGGADNRILLKDGPSAPILVAYLTRSTESDFHANSVQNLTQLLKTLAEENKIAPNNINLMGLRLLIDKEKSQVNLATAEVFGSWKFTFNKMIQTISSTYKPKNKVYTLELVDFKSPENSVKIGDEVVLQIKLKNTSDNIIFADGDSQLFMTTADGKDSQLFVNNVWVSKSQIPLLPEGTAFKPLQEASFDFKVKAPFVFGKVAQAFVLKNAVGQVIANIKINVELNVDRAGAKVLQVTNTEGGTLRIRQTPSANAPVLAKASEGSRYFWSEKSDSGWYKIAFDGGEGWVLGKYVRVL